MADFGKIAKEVLEVLRSYIYTVLMYDENDMKVIEPEEARRFFDRKKNLTVVIKDDDDNSSLELSYGKKTHMNDIMGLDLTLKTLATKFSLIYSAGRFSKQIEPKDVTDLGSLTEQDKKMLLSPLTEGMYGTTRSSYLRLENARMIVRHSKKINDSMIGARGRCVESIFIENDSGERLLFPSTQLAPARAMTQHVNHGGTFADPIGGEIMRMSTDYGHLSQASNYVANNAVGLAEGAMNVREACRGKMRKLRKTFERLSKQSSYAKESETVMECAKSLKENEVAMDETRLSELRQLLNNADLPREVYECAGKAMDEMKETAPITEEEPAPPSDDDEAEASPDWTPKPGTTVGFLDWRVSKVAWRQLEHGMIVVSGPPSSKTDRDEGQPMEFADPLTKLCYALGKWVPVIKDETLANLLGNIADKIRETPEAVSMGIRRDRKVERDYKKHLPEMVKLAVKALKARKVRLKDKMEGAGMGGVPAVAEHFSWLGKFDTDKVLSEDFSGLGDWGDPVGNGYDDVKTNVITNFDANDFATSPEVSEMVGDKNATNPDENKLDHDEIMTALRAYIQRQMEDLGGVDDSFSLYMTDTQDDDEIADSVYDDACAALQKEGWIVENTGNMEEVEEDDGFGEDDFDLTMSDIMVPTPDMGGSLQQQVGKKMVHDPDHHDELRKPDDVYLARLLTLGGVQNGSQTGQAY